MKSGHTIKIVEARKNYGALAALNGLSLDIKAGQFTVLLGPSGSGKSTLIRSLAGIEKLDSGSIFFGDREVNRGPINLAPEKRDLAMVFQDYALWPHLTASENVGYALKRRKLSPDRFKSSINEALARVGLESKGGNYPHQLSGGEQQRVAIARAMVRKPKLLFADEPTGNLDERNGQLIMDQLFDLNRRENLTVVIITHEPKLAARCDRILWMTNGQVAQS